MNQAPKHYFHITCICAVIMGMLLIAAIILTDKISADMSTKIIHQELTQINHFNHPIHHSGNKIT